MKPEGYPLEWCDQLGIPYWKLNLYCIFVFKGYQDWQSKKRMSEIIPVLDKVLSMFERKDLL